MKRYKGIIGFFRMKYEQFIIREVDRLELGFIWENFQIDKDKVYEEECERYLKLFYNID